MTYELSKEVLTSHGDKGVFQVAQAFFMFFMQE